MFLDQFPRGVFRANMFAMRQYFTLVRPLQPAPNAPYNYFNCRDVGWQYHCFIRRRNCRPKAPSVANVAYVMRTNPGHERSPHRNMLIIYRAIGDIRAGTVIISHWGPDQLDFNWSHQPSTAINNHQQPSKNGQIHVACPSGSTLRWCRIVSKISLFPKKKQNLIKNTKKYQKKTKKKYFSTQNSFFGIEFIFLLKSEASA